MSLRNSKIQSILFPVDKFTQEQIEQWAQEKHFHHKFGNKKQLQTVDQHIELKQKHMSKKADVNYAIIDLDKEQGIKAKIQYRTCDFTAKGHFKQKTKKEPQETPTPSE